MSLTAATQEILIAGNPNSGKSTLFNALSGGSARVGNYPGVTVDRTTATVNLSAQRVALVDIPGMYSLTANSPEEQLAVDALVASETRAVVCVVDATTLQRGLYLALQLRESGVPVVVALNMMDAAERMGLRIDTDLLSESFGAPVVPVVATKRQGLDVLLNAVEDQLGLTSSVDALSVSYPAALETDLSELVPLVERWRPGASRQQTRAVALWCLLSLEEDSLRGVPDSLRKAVQRLRSAAIAQGRNSDLEIIATRYAWIEEQVSRASPSPDPMPSVSERIDNVLTHPVSGLLAFAIVMFMVFEALFTWAEPAIGFIEDLTAALQGQIAR